MGVCVTVGESLEMRKETGTRCCSVGIFRILSLIGCGEGRSER